MGDRQAPLDDLLADEDLSLEEGGVPAEVRQRLVWPSTWTTWWRRVG